MQAGWLSDGNARTRSFQNALETLLFASDWGRTDHGPHAIFG
jgi:hypothetical protein